MHFLPILSTLRRHRTAAALIVLQIAVTCAIVCNAIFLIGGRLDRLDLPSGTPEDELIRVQITSIGKDLAAAANTVADLEALRALPGVRSVANANMVPFGSSSWNTGASTKPDDGDPPIDAGIWLGSEDLLETLGVNLIAGRDFEPGEYVSMDDEKAVISSVIVTRAVAEKLYPGEDAVGKPIYAWGDSPHIIVGIVDQLIRPNAYQGRNNDEDSMILPVRLSYTSGPNYVLRVDPAQKRELLAAAGTTLLERQPNRILLDRQTFGDLRAKYFEQDRAMAYLLVGVCVLLLVITALGIVGLASFWVQQRTRQIGIRRALGASRGQILSYFHTENFILATLGIVLGMLLAFAINHWLMDAYHVGRLPAVFLPVGAVLLWILGQVAVLGPALRAAAVPPAVATRSV